MVLKKIRTHIAGRKLSKKFPPKTVERKMFDFDSAKQVGILYHLSDSESELALKEFSAFLRQKGIAFTVLGYFHGKKLPPNLMIWKDINYLTKKDSDWLSIPHSETARSFVKKDFDILINCSMRRFRVLDHLVQSSAAACKIGPDMSGSNLYDLVIDVSRSASVKFFLDNLRNYLPLLKQQCILTKEEK